MKNTFIALVTLGATFAAAAACSSTDGSNSDQADGGASGGVPGGSSGFGSSGDNEGGLGTPGSPGTAGSSGLGACIRSTQKVEVLPIDMSLLVDTSGSMDYKAAPSDFASKWTNVRSALKAFTGNPSYDNLGVALEFFPRTYTCDTAGYATPDIPFATLPGASTALYSALNAQGMAGGTPTTQALQGMVQYTRAHAALASDKRKAVVVLATDGVPDGSCAGNAVTDAIAQASAAFNGTPSVPVYVIGIGQLAADNAVMDRIALAGGTGHAELVTVGSDIEATFLAALNKIRKTAISCDYPLPAGQTDISQVNVQFTNGNTQSIFFYAADAAQCALAGDHGWTVDNPAAPTKVVLCPDTCTRVKAADEGGRIDVVFGCPRIDVK